VRNNIAEHLFALQITLCLICVESMIQKKIIRPSPSFILQLIPFSDKTKLKICGGNRFFRRSTALFTARSFVFYLIDGFVIAQVRLKSNQTDVSNDKQTQFVINRLA
jgi:hypothetical protein